MRIEAVATGCAILRRGASVTLDGLGRQFNGTYRIVQCTHRFDDVHGYRTEFHAVDRA